MFLLGGIYNIKVVYQYVRKDRTEWFYWIHDAKIKLYS